MALPLTTGPFRGHKCPFDRFTESARKAIATRGPKKALTKFAQSQSVKFKLLFRLLPKSERKWNRFDGNYRRDIIAMAHLHDQRGVGKVFLSNDTELLDHNGYSVETTANIVE